MRQAAPTLQRRRPVSNETGKCSNFIMTILMIAMFMMVLFSPTSKQQKTKSEKNSALRNQVDQPHFHDVDPSEMGMIKESKTNTDKDNSNNNRNNGSSQSAANDSDDKVGSEDDMYIYDIQDTYMFERDADFLDAQSAVEEAMTQLEDAMDTKLFELQPKIEKAIISTLNTLQQTVKELNDQQKDKTIQFDVDHIKTINSLIEGELRDETDKRIQDLCDELLDEKKVEIIAIVDIDEEYEMEGSGDPIDLNDEVEELIEQVIEDVDEIVVSIVKEDMPIMAYEALKRQIELALQTYFGKQRKIVVDANNKDKKVNGWHENKPKSEKPEKDNENKQEQPTKKSTDTQEKKDKESEAEVETVADDKQKEAPKIPKEDSKAKDNMTDKTSPEQSKGNKSEPEKPSESSKTAKKADEEKS